jgi:DNA-directed RNA polymerase specialized sigma24 family protein
VGGDWPEVASSADHLQDVETAEEVEQLMRRLAGLPERERIAVCAFFFDQHDARQAADLLGVSLSGFYGILGRALRRLAALLGRREVRKGE